MPGSHEGHDTTGRPPGAGTVGPRERGFSELEITNATDLKGCQWVVGFYGE
jgi:hypothetical protein